MKLCERLATMVQNGETGTPIVLWEQHLAELSVGEPGTQHLVTGGDDHGGCRRRDCPSERFLGSGGLLEAPQSEPY